MRWMLALLIALPAAAQMQTLRAVCDLNGMPGQMTIQLEAIQGGGIVRDAPGPTANLELLMTGDYSVRVAGELRSATGYYTFFGTAPYADVLDHMSGARFRIRFVPEGPGLWLVINPHAGPGRTTRHYCR